MKIEVLKLGFNIKDVVYYEVRAFEQADLLG